MKLSVIIPVYNEIQTLEKILKKIAGVLPDIPKEIVMVDDGSRDGTREWLVETFGDPEQHPVSSYLDQDQTFCCQPLGVEKYQSHRHALGRSRLFSIGKTKAMGAR